MFFVGWEMQYDKNSCSYGQLVIGTFILSVSLLTCRVSCKVFGKITQVTQPPYSLDLVSCNFWFSQN